MSAKGEKSVGNSPLFIGKAGSVFTWPAPLAHRPAPLSLRGPPLPIRGPPIAGRSHFCLFQWRLVSVVGGSFKRKDVLREKQAKKIMEAMSLGECETVKAVHQVYTLKTANRYTFELLLNLQAGGEYEDKDKDFEDIRRSPYNDKDTEDIRRYS
ncbi:hypothetical protein Tco_0882700 [Tanacetum coccineum]